MALATNHENALAASTLSQGRDSAKTPAGNIVAHNSESRSATAGVRPATKTDVVIDLLRRADGASLSEVSAATGWQAHSVRGFLSGTVRKKLGLNLISKLSGEGVRRYTIDDRAILAGPAQPIDLPPFGSFKGASAIDQADAAQGA